MEIIAFMQAFGALAGIILTMFLCVHVKRKLKARR